MFYSIENFYSGDDLPKEFFCRKIERTDVSKKLSTSETINNLSNDDFTALVLLLLLG